MVQEEIIVNVKAVSQLKGLIQARDDLRKLEKVGIRAVSGRLRDMNGKFIKTSDAVKKASGVLGRFKFELLGVLFFGMAVTRFMTGLLKPAFEVAGVFEIMNDTLALFFLPTATQVSDILLNISERLTALPEPIQEFVGNLVLLGAALGTGLFLLGTFGLGLKSLEIAFGLSAGSIALLLGQITLVASAVIGAILLFKNWDKINASLKLGLAASLVLIGAIGLAIGAPFIAAFGLVSAAIVGLIAIFKNWNSILETTLSLLNRIPGINIAGPNTTAADVIAVSGQAIAQANPVPGGPFNIGDFSPVVNVTVTQSLDENAADLGTEIGNIVNETIARGVGDLARR